MDPLQLEVIHQAFGEAADLYTDVLRVRPNASDDQIQRAYFERRNDLFAHLAQLESMLPDQDSATATQRSHAERKMDAVVMTLRILGNPAARAQYDHVRAERMRPPPRGGGLPHRLPKQSPAQPTPESRHMLHVITASNQMDAGDIPMKPKSVLKAKSAYAASPSTSPDAPSPRATGGRSQRHSQMLESTSPDRSSVTFGSDPSASSVSLSPIRNTKVVITSTSSTTSRKSNKRKVRRVSPDQPRNSKKGGTPQRATTSKASTVAAASDVEESVASDEDDVDDEGSFRTLETTLTMYEKNRGYFQAIRDEILGALDDTSQSFHQVFSVFTLREDEIDAVTGRIDKARRQMVNSFAK